MRFLILIPLLFSAPALAMTAAERADLHAGRSDLARMVYCVDMHGPVRYASKTVNNRTTRR